MHRRKPFNFVIDLTGGEILKHMKRLKGVPSWIDFSMSRVRQATDISLPTSGHLLSHNKEEMESILDGQNLENVLVFDDTSFSGSTSLIVEDLIRNAGVSKSSFTHGFLILNTGDLGPNPGASTRFEESKSKAISGMEMKTPRDDGWHFFDLVKQENLSEHLVVVKQLLSFLGEPNFSSLASSILVNEESLKLLFPKMITTEVLEGLRSSGHFVGDKKLEGKFHVKNPQLFHTIVGQGHLLSPEDWKKQPDEVFELLIKLSKILKKGK